MIPTSRSLIRRRGFSEHSLAFGCPSLTPDLESVFGSIVNRGYFGMGVMYSGTNIMNGLLGSKKWADVNLGTQGRQSPIRDDHELFSCYVSKVVQDEPIKNGMMINNIDKMHPADYDIDIVRNLRKDFCKPTSDCISLIIQREGYCVFLYTEVDFLRTKDEEEKKFLKEAISKLSYGLFLAK